LERKNVGLTLKVKPQINEGSGVKLKIEQEVSGVVPSASAVDVITSKRKIKTTVMVDNNNSRSNKNQQMALIICFGVITKQMP
jgi:general secretion pathway protein D